MLLVCGMLTRISMFPDQRWSVIRAAQFMIGDSFRTYIERTNRETKDFHEMLVPWQRIGLNDDKTLSLLSKSDTTGILTVIAVEKGAFSASTIQRHNNVRMTHYRTVSHCFFRYGNTLKNLHPALLRSFLFFSISVSNNNLKIKKWRKALRLKYETKNERSQTSSNVHLFQPKRRTTP